MKKVRKTTNAYNVFNRVDFKRFMRKHPEYSEDLKTEKDFNGIMKKFHERIALEMQQNPNGVIFPETNFILFIANIGKPKNKVRNRYLSAKYDKPIFFSNHLTDGNLMKIIFLNKTVESRVENSTLFSFHASTRFRSSCSKHFIKNWLGCVTHILR